MSREPPFRTPISNNRTGRHRYGAKILSYSPRYNDHLSDVLPSWLSYNSLIVWKLIFHQNFPFPANLPCDGQQLPPTILLPLTVLLVSVNGPRFQMPAPRPKVLLPLTVLLVSESTPKFCAPPPPLTIPPPAKALLLLTVLSISSLCRRC